MSLRDQMLAAMDKLTPKRSPFKNRQKPTVEELRKVGAPGVRPVVRYLFPLQQNHDGKTDGRDFLFAGVNRATSRKLAREERTIRDFRGIPPRKRRHLDTKLTLQAALRAEGRKLVTGEGN